MEIIREPEFNLNDYDHDYFLNEILAVYEEADPKTKAHLLSLLWQIRQDKKFEINSEKRSKEMMECFGKAFSSMGG